jgi:hypothetical protein
MDAVSQALLEAQNKARARLVGDLGGAFRQGKDYFENNPQLTAGELYDFVADLATQRGWEFGAPTAGTSSVTSLTSAPPGNPSGFRSVTVIRSLCASRMIAAVRAIGFWKFISWIGCARSAVSSRSS